MKARTPGRIDIIDAVKSHPILTKRQKDELCQGFEKYVRRIALDALANMLDEYEMELSAQSLIVLYHEFNFNEAMLKKFAREFNGYMKHYAEFLRGAASVAEGAYYDLHSLFPNCDEWIKDGADEK